MLKFIIKNIHPPKSDQEEIFVPITTRVGFKRNESDPNGSDAQEIRFQFEIRKYRLGIPKSNSGRYGLARLQFWNQLTSLIHRKKSIFNNFFCWQCLYSPFLKILFIKSVSVGLYFMGFALSY